MKYETIISDIKLNNFQLSFQTFKDFSTAVDDFCEFYASSTDSKVLEEYSPYFGHIWPSSLVLSQYMIQLNSDNKSKLQDQKILEIGSGLAIPSFVCKKMGLDIAASDFHIDILSFLNENQKLNNTYFDFFQTNWTQLDSVIKNFNLIIGSDILYELPQVGTLVNLFKNASNGQEIIITDPGRTYIQPFLDEMKKIGFKEKYPVQIQKNPLGNEEIFILHLFR
ncbi:MAG: hypothetical protein U0T83_06525 [Bacteriovoracaceae bacterium]